jgi:site-specific recombinase XerD
MRANRVLVAKGWYWVSTDVNNREAVFQLPQAVRRLREVRKIYEFEVRELRVEDDRVSFYINAEDGFQLPEIIHHNNIEIVAYPKKTVKYYRHIF